MRRSIYILAFAILLQIPLGLVDKSKSIPDGLAKRAFIQPLKPLPAANLPVVQTVAQMEVPTPKPEPKITTSQNVATACSDAKSCIYFHESGNNPGSINPDSGACGLGQAWPCSKMPCGLSDYNCQDIFFTQYMLGRYGSWDAAWSYWQAHSNW